LTVAPTGLSNLNNTYNPASGTLDTRNNAQQAQDPASLLCSLLRTTGDEGGKNPGCKELKKLFDSLPELPTGSTKSTAVTGTVDRTLGGILGASA